jgi:hypothetical protein
MHQKRQTAWNATPPMLFTASRELENDNSHLSKSIVHILARDRVKFRLAWSSEVWYRARVWLIVTAMIAA